MVTETRVVLPDTFGVNNERFTTTGIPIRYFQAILDNLRNNASFTESERDSVRVAIDDNGSVLIVYQKELTPYDIEVKKARGRLAVIRGILQQIDTQEKSGKVDLASIKEQLRMVVTAAGPEDQNAAG